MRKEYRDGYVAEHTRTGIAYQIRAMREGRGWAQKKLANELKKPPSVVSRLEDPDYGKPSVQTLLEIASAFDVALLIQFVSYPEFLRRTRDVSPEALDATSFDLKQFMPIPGVRITPIASTPSAEVVMGRFGSSESIAIAVPQRASALSITRAVH
jgi:transcriptional regulator with XRE-family HTH domain